MEVGTGTQTETVSVRVSDPDEDLTEVKVARRFNDGTKEQVLLLDDGKGVDRFLGNGRFTGIIDIDTSEIQRISLEIKAKDTARNAVTVGSIVSVVDSAIAPAVVELDVSPSILHEATGLQLVTITATVTDPNFDLKVVRLELLHKPGQSKRAEDGKLGKLLDSGTDADAVAGDGAYTIELEIDTAEAGVIPFRLKVKDVAGHKVEREYDLVIKPDK